MSFGIRYNENRECRRSSYSAARRKASSCCSSEAAQPDVTGIRIDARRHDLKSVYTSALVRQTALRSVARAVLGTFTRAAPVAWRTDGRTCLLLAVNSARAERRGREGTPGFAAPTAWNPVASYFSDYDIFSIIVNGNRIAVTNRQYKGLDIVTI